MYKINTHSIIGVKSLVVILTEGLEWPIMNVLLGTLFPDQAKIMFFFLAEKGSTSDFCYRSLLRDNS